MLCGADASSTSVRLCPLLMVMLDCTKLFPHICTAGVLPLLLPLLLLLPQLPALPLQAVRRSAARLTRTNNNTNFFMMHTLLLPSDHLQRQSAWHYVLTSPFSHAIHPP